MDISCNYIYFYLKAPKCGKDNKLTLKQNSFIASSIWISGKIDRCDCLLILQLIFQLEYFVIVLSRHITDQIISFQLEISRLSDTMFCIVFLNIRMRNKFEENKMTENLKIEVSSSIMVGL